MSTLAKPTVHMNGTSRSVLQDDVEQAIDALQAALFKLGETSPNSRDYYVKGNGWEIVYSQAVEEHITRVRKIKSVVEELSELRIALEPERNTSKPAILGAPYDLSKPSLTVRDFIRQIEDGE